MPALNTVVRFRQKQRTRFGQPKTPQGKQPVHRKKSSRRKIGLAIAKMVTGALVATAAFGAYQLSGAGGIEAGAVLASAPQQDLLSASFAICGDGPRVTCVVDGDTFWHQGVKIRIADIDTPELSPPRCEAERVKGEAAKRRLRDLLNAGKFSLVAGWGDEDRHGRKLMTVTRHGRSIGEILIAEGLARRWDGAQAGLVRLTHQQRESVGRDRFRKVVGRRFQRKRDSGPCLARKPGPYIFAASIRCGTCGDSTCSRSSRPCSAGLRSSATGAASERTASR